MPPISPEERLLRRVPPTFYPDPEQPRKPQWLAFRPTKHDSDGISVGRRSLIVSLEDFSYMPDRSNQRHVAQVVAGDVQSLGLTVEPRPLPGDRSHAVVPELNFNDYNESKEKKRLFKSWAARLADEHAEMVFLLDSPRSGPMGGAGR